MTFMTGFIAAIAAAAAVNLDLRNDVSIGNYRPT